MEDFERHLTFARVRTGPSGSRALSGLWRMQKVRNVSTTGPTPTYRITKDAVMVTEDPMSFTTSFGKEYPVRGIPSQTVSVTRVSREAIEETYKQDGKVITVRAYSDRRGRQVNQS